MTRKTTTMTTMTTTSQQQAAFRKAVRARSLTDPLGAMGFRTHSQQVQKETRIRRLIFAATTLGFAGILGAVIVTAPPQAPTASSAGLVSAADNTPVQNPRVISRSSQSNQQPVHTRTRGS